MRLFLRRIFIRIFFRNNWMLLVINALCLDNLKNCINSFQFFAIL